MKIQPFQYSDEEYAAWIELRQRLDSEVHLTADLLRQEERQLRAENHVTRILATVENQTVASGVYWHSSVTATKPHQFSFAVHPDYQESDIPGQIHAYLLAQIMKEQPTAIVSEANEDEGYRIRSLEDSNFQPKMRFPRSRLDVTTLNIAAYQEQMTRLGQQGIEFVTLTDIMQADPNWQRNVWQMFTIIEQDVPDPEPGPATSFEEYAAYYKGDLFRPDSWAIAVDTALEGAQRYVGMCVVNITPTRPNALFAGITGVVPGHRRRKIATILKVCSAKYAQQHGYRYIRTNNEENNPMYDLNVQLGFEPLPATIYYRKET